MGAAKSLKNPLQQDIENPITDLGVNRHSTVTHYQRPNITHPQEGGTGGEVSEILFFSAKSKRHPSLIYSMQIIPVCLFIVARRKGVPATRRGGLNWTPISLLVGHPCKLFHNLGPLCSYSQIYRLESVRPLWNGGSKIKKAKQQIPTAVSVVLPV